MENNNINLITLGKTTEEKIKDQVVEILNTYHLAVVPQNIDKIAKIYKQEFIDKANVGAIIKIHECLKD